MNENEKVCTRCQKRKDINLFYKQGNRYESLCKDCKRGARAEREEKSSTPAQPKTPATTEKKKLSYEDFGLTKDEFQELASFFERLWELKTKGELNGSNHSL